MRTLSQKLEGAKRYVIHPDYKVGLEMLEEFIEEAKQLETKVKNLTIPDVVGRSEQLESELTCMMCKKPKQNDGHTCCEECAGLAF